MNVELKWLSTTLGGCITPPFFDPCLVCFQLIIQFESLNSWISKGIASSTILAAGLASTRLKSGARCPRNDLRNDQSSQCWKWLGVTTAHEVFNPGITIGLGINQMGFEVPWSLDPFACFDPTKHGQPTTRWFQQAKDPEDKYFPNNVCLWFVQPTGATCILLYHDLQVPNNAVFVLVQVHSYASIADLPMVQRAVGEQWSFFF